MRKVRPIVAMVTALFCCCMNVILLEKMVKESPNCTVLVTFSGFVFIILQGLCFHPEYLYKNQIPLRNYLIITVLFFTSNLANMVALSYDVDMPTVLIFRSGSLVANLIVSLIAFRRSYPISKYISVVTVTAGVLISTIATAKVKTQEAGEEGGDLTRWVVGILMLAYGLFGSATLGVFQEKMFNRFGKHPKEVLFYNHLLGMAGFIFSYPTIMGSMVEFNSSPPLIWGVPSLWVYLGMNVAMQNLCVRSIYYLLSEWTSLAVTLVTTLRKFLSLLLSIVLFNNTFTLDHWLSAVLVFSGSAIFSGLVKLPREDRLEAWWRGVTGRGEERREAQKLPC